MHRTSSSFLTLWPEPRYRRPKYAQFLSDATELKRNGDRVWKLDEEIEMGLLMGNLETDICREGRVVRVFTSSTFTDTEIERNALMGDVYGYLDDLCRRLELSFEIIDLRWGIRSIVSDTHTITDVCEREMLKCLKLSSAIAVVAFTGDKYGYRPFPRKIPAEEFEAIIAADDIPRQLLEKWFRKDENAIPPEYVLLPVTTHLPNFASKDPAVAAQASSQWWVEFEEMQRTLRLGASSVLTDDAKHKYFCSVTERELELGIFSNPNRARQSIAFLRHVDIEQAMLDDECVKYKFVDRDEDGLKLAQSLKSRIKELLPEENIVERRVPWVKGAGNTLDDNLEYIRELCDSFCDRCVRSIFAHYHRNCVDPWLEEVMHHNEFARKKLGHKGFPRLELRQEILEANINNDTNTPLLLVGNSGTGKSWLMAHAAYDAVVKLQQGVVVLRFLGISALSSDVHSLIMSTCQQITKAYGTTDIAIPSDSFTALTNCFKDKVLPLATADRPLFIFWDSVDQLSESNNALRDLSWIPFKLPPHCHVVVSMIATHQNLVEGFHSHRQSSSPTITIPASMPITEQTARSTIVQSLGSQNPPRAVTSDQLDALVLSFLAQPNPLYLQLSLDMATSWNSFTPPEHSTLPYLMLPRDNLNGIRGLIHHRFALLEEIHGHKFVSATLGLITMARDGLSNPEVEHIMSSHDEVLDDIYQFWSPPMRVLPPSLWLRLRSDLNDFLIERGHNLVLTWFHRQFREVAEERYQNADAAKRIAEFFDGTLHHRYKDRNIPSQPLTFDTNAAEHQHQLQAQVTYNLRKLYELARAMVKANMWVELLDHCLGDINYIQTKLHCAPHDLLEDYIVALSSIDSSEHENIAATLQYLYQFLKQQFWILCHQPGLLKQQILNDPTAKKKIGHLLVSDECGLADHSAPCGTALIVSDEDENTGEKKSGAELLMTVNCSQPEWVLGCCFLSPRVLLTVGACQVKAWDCSSCLQTAAMFGHVGTITGCSEICLFENQHFVATSSCDGTVRVWNIDKSELFQTLVGTKGANYDCVGMIGGDLALAFAGCSNGDIVCWNVLSGSLLWQVEAAHTFTPNHAENLKVMTHLRDGVSALCAIPCCKSQVSIIASCGSDGKIKVFNATTGALLSSSEMSHEAEITCLDSFVGAADGEQMLLLASGSWDKTVQIWDRAWTRVSLLQHETQVTACKFSLDGRWLAAGLMGARGVVLWDRVAKVALQTLQGHSYTINALAFESTTRETLAVAFSNAIKVWDLSNLSDTAQVETSSSKHHNSCISDCAFSKDGRFLATCSMDIIRIWDTSVAPSCPLYKQLSHIGSVYSLDFSEHYLASSCWLSEPLGVDPSLSTFKVWKLPEFNATVEGSGHKHGIVGIAISPDEQYVLTASLDHTAKYWKMNELVSTLAGHSDAVRAVSFSRYDEEQPQAMTASTDGTCRIWQLGDTCTCLHVLVGHSRWVRDCAWGFSVSADKTVRMWNMLNGTLQDTVVAHSHIIWRIKLNREATKLVTCSEDGCGKLYNVRSDSIQPEYSHCFAPGIGLRCAALQPPHDKMAAFGAVDGSWFLTQLN